MALREMCLKHSLNEEQTFIFNFIEGILFFLLYGNKLFFQKHTAPHSPDIKWSVRPLIILYCNNTQYEVEIQYAITYQVHNKHYYTKND